MDDHRNVHEGILLKIKHKQNVRPDMNGAIGNTLLFIVPLTFVVVAVVEEEEETWP